MIHSGRFEIFCLTSVYCIHGAQLSLKLAGHEQTNGIPQRHLPLLRKAYYTPSTKKKWSLTPSTDGSPIGSDEMELKVLAARAIPREENRKSSFGSWHHIGDTEQCHRTLSFPDGISCPYFPSFCCACVCCLASSGVSSSFLSSTFVPILSLHKEAESLNDLYWLHSFHQSFSSAKMSHNAAISPPPSKTIEANEYLTKDEYGSEDLQSISPEEKKAITKRMLFKLDCT